MLQGVYMFADVNLALKKTAIQSDSHRHGAAWKAVDGCTDQVYSGGCCSHTQTKTNSWWEVDLGQQYPIRDVVIYNRMDCMLFYVHVLFMACLKSGFLCNAWLRIFTTCMLKWKSSCWGHVVVQRSNCWLLVYIVETVLVIVTSLLTITIMNKLLSKETYCCKTFYTQSFRNNTNVLYVNEYL